MNGWLGMGREPRADRKLRDPSSTQGHYAAHVEAHFREMADGRTIFRQGDPFNRRGYIVASTDQMLLLKESVVQYRRILMTAYIIFVLAFSGLLSSSFFEWKLWMQMALFVGISAIYSIATRVYFYPITKQLESIKIPISWLSNRRHMGRTMSSTSLACLTLSSVAVAVFMFVIYVKRSQPIFLIMSLSVSGSLVGQAIAWRNWWRARHE